MKRINLLPKTAQKEISLDIFAQKLFNFWIVVLVSFVVLFLLALGSQIFLNKKIGSTAREIVVKQAQLTSSDNQQLEQQVIALNDQIKIIEDLKVRHYYWSEALLELANLMPADLQVSILSLDRSTNKIDVIGTGGSRESVIQFWANVKKSKYFSDINFPLTNLEKPNNAPYTYTLTINPKQIQK